MSSVPLPILVILIFCSVVKAELADTESDQITFGRWELNDFVLKTPEDANKRVYKEPPLFLSRLTTSSATTGTSGLGSSLFHALYRHLNNSSNNTSASAISDSADTNNAPADTVSDSIQSAVTSYHTGIPQFSTFSKIQPAPYAYVKSAAITNSVNLTPIVTMKQVNNTLDYLPSESIAVPSVAKFPNYNNNNLEHIVESDESRIDTNEDESQFLEMSSNSVEMSLNTLMVNDFVHESENQVQSNRFERDSEETEQSSSTEIRSAVSDATEQSSSSEIKSAVSDATDEEVTYTVSVENDTEESNLIELLNVMEKQKSVPSASNLVNKHKSAKMSERSAELIAVQKTKQPQSETQDSDVKMKTTVEPTKLIKDKAPYVNQESYPSFNEDPLQVQTFESNGQFDQMFNNIANYQLLGYQVQAGNIYPTHMYYPSNYQQIQAQNIYRTHAYHTPYYN